MGQRQIGVHPRSDTKSVSARSMKKTVPRAAKEITVKIVNEICAVDIAGFNTRFVTVNHRVLEPKLVAGRPTLDISVGNVLGPPRILRECGPQDGFVFLTHTS